MLRYVPAPKALTQVPGPQGGSKGPSFACKTVQVGPWTRTKRQSREEPLSAGAAPARSLLVSPPAFSDLTNVDSPGVRTRSASKTMGSQLLVQ